jgi:hypothetical protein
MRALAPQPQPTFARGFAGGARACALAVLSLLCACDGGARPIDAQAQPATASSELSVRFDLSAGSSASVSVLGFRAATAGSDDTDVLGLVDPLAAAAPDQGCAIRDADLATRALASRGGSVDLEELPGVAVGLGSEANMLRPFPRVFPDVAGVVAGVVAEAGPQPVAALPERVTFYSPESELPVGELPVPALPRLLAINGAAPVAGARIDTSEGLTLSLGAAAGAVVELRPFGSTLAVTCSVPTNASTESLLTISRPLLAHLPSRIGTTAAGLTTRAGSNTVAVSLEVVRRVRARAPLGATGTRVSVEVRGALPVELRP